MGIPGAKGDTGPAVRIFKSSSYAKKPPQKIYGSPQSNLILKFELYTLENIEIDYHIKFLEKKNILALKGLFLEPKY